MKIRKIGFLIACFMVLGLSACSGNVDSPSQTDSDPTSINPPFNSGNSEGEMEFEYSTIKLVCLKNYNATLGDINMFDDIEEQLYSSFCVLNTYDEFIYLKNNFNSSESVFEKLLNLLDNINYDKTYFENKSIIISPFLHSSDEKNISLLDIQIDDIAKKIGITFQFESPASVDCDIVVDFFVIEVDKQDFVDRGTYSKEIYGYNSLLNSSGSSCYSHKEEK